jgi:hypothetical protein
MGRGRLWDGVAESQHRGLSLSCLVLVPQRMRQRRVRRDTAARTCKVNAAESRVTGSNGEEAITSRTGTWHATATRFGKIQIESGLKECEGSSMDIFISHSLFKFWLNGLNIY